LREQNKREAPWSFTQVQHSGRAKSQQRNQNNVTNGWPQLNKRENEILDRLLSRALQVCK
jgi:hypothetical protein